jgi:hypothetical protein
VRVAGASSTLPSSPIDFFRRIRIFLSSRPIVLFSPGPRATRRPVLGASAPTAGDLGDLAPLEGYRLRNDKWDAIRFWGARRIQDLVLCIRFQVPGGHRDSLSGESTNSTADLRPTLKSQLSQLASMNLFNTWPGCNPTDRDARRSTLLKTLLATVYSDPTFLTKHDRWHQVARHSESAIAE